MGFENFLPNTELNTPTLMVFAALAIASVLATAVSCFKAVQFISSGLGQHKATQKRTTQWLAGEVDDAISSAQSSGSVLARVQLATMTAVRARPRDTNYAEEIARQSATFELQRLSRHMRVLEAVVQAAPMLGLLGTVIGMIEAFGKISQSVGAVDPAMLAGGIWTALTTTALGLSIAVIFYFISMYLEGRIDRTRDAMNLMISTCIYGRVET